MSYLRIRWPIGKGFQSLSDSFITENVKCSKLSIGLVQQSYGLTTKSY